MPNYCYYEMRVKGKPENVNQFILSLQSDYGYTPVEISNRMLTYPRGKMLIYPNDNNRRVFKVRQQISSPHLFRVFEANVNETECFCLPPDENGDIIRAVSGYCAWSVYSCMFEGRCTYYNDFMRDFGIRYIGFFGTTIPKLSRLLNLDIEIFSEETGVCFQEHYRVTNGNIIINDEVHITVDYDEETQEDIIQGGFDWKFNIK